MVLVQRCNNCFHLASPLNHWPSARVPPPHITGDDDYRRGIFDSLQLGCIPVLLPQQRVPLQFMLDGVLRRAGLTLDDVFYFLVRPTGGSGTMCLSFLRDGGVGGE